MGHHFSLPTIHFSLYSDFHIHKEANMVGTAELLVILRRYPCFVWRKKSSLNLRVIWV